MSRLPWTPKVMLLAVGSLCFLQCMIRRATIDTYVDANYGPGVVHKVAIFPIVNARLAASEAQQINRKVSTEIHRKNPGILIMSSAEATQILNEHSLASDWATFLNNYVSSGVPDATVLSRIGRTLGVDAIIQGELVNIFQQDGAFGLGKGTTRVTVRFSMLGVEDGKLLWEASSDGIIIMKRVFDPAPAVIDAVRLAVDKIIQQLPF